MPRENKGYWLKQNKRNGVYEVVYSSKGRNRRISTRTGNLTEAKAFLETYKVEAAKIELRQSKITVDQILDYYEEHHVKPAVIGKKTHFGFSRIIRAFFGMMIPEEITHIEMARYAAERRAGKVGTRKTKDSTIRRELTILSAACHFAKKRKLITAEEMPVIEMPPAPPPRNRWLTKEEVEKFLFCAEIRRYPQGDRLSRLERYLAIALNTAARMSAILELKWDQVDFETGVINFNKNDRAQTNKRRAAVPISSALLPVLQKAYRDKYSEYVLDFPGHIKRSFYKCVAAAGLEKVSPHVLRHTAATHMARNGTPLWVIAGILGNSVRMVEQVYAHHCPDHLKAGVDIMAGVCNLPQKSGVTHQNTLQMANNDQQTTDKSL